MNQEPDNLVARALKILKGDHPESSDKVLIEPASPTARPVFWERGDGRIEGPARLEFLACVGAGSKARFWIVLTFHNVVCWVRSDRLRSRQAFEAHSKAGKEPSCHPT